MTQLQECPEFSDSLIINELGEKHNKHALCFDSKNANFLFRFMAVSSFDKQDLSAILENVHNLFDDIDFEMLNN